MRVLINRNTESDRVWLLFDQHGKIVPESEMERFSSKFGPSGGGMVVNLREGTYWLLCVSRFGLHVRFLSLTDTYPLGSEEILATIITTTFCFSNNQKEDAQVLRQELELGTKKTTKKHLQYPQELIEAICTSTIEMK